MSESEKLAYDNAKKTLQPDEYREFDRRFKLSRESVDLMDETMINNFNSKVPVNGLTYFLGDISFYKDLNKTISLLKRMNGRKILIAGNHDKYMVKEKDFRSRNLYRYFVLSFHQHLNKKSSNHPPLCTML